MQRIKSALLVGAAIVAVGLGGCATKDFVREQVAVVDAKAQANQAALDKQQASLDQQQAQLGKLDQTAQDALNRATAAGKLAEGKFLYSMVLSDDSVKFPANSAQLSPEAQERLTSFVEKLKSENRNVYLEIQGHTDAQGAAAANQRLGAARAEAVRVFMSKNGVPLSRMATISYGEDDPVADNTTPQGRAQNRRVVLIVMS